MTKISIVTPSLNQGRYLGEALNSVRLQDCRDVEHLILDGGSTDETVSLLRALNEQARWSHVRWWSGPDGGQSEALNRGFAEAKGDIIGWLNSDDRYRSGCFESIIKAFDDNPSVDIFYGDFAVIDQEGTVLQVRREIGFNHFILLYHHVLYIPTPSTFFRRRIFEDGNWLKPELHYAMDYEFFLRLASAGYRIRHLPRVIADFRLHPQSKSCSMEQVQSKEKQRILWSASSIPLRFRSPDLRRIAFLGLQTVAGVMRWSEKFLRGYYFSQHRPNSLRD
jgi:glycosyltransferase involved in cell wall biosynthesis